MSEENKFVGIIMPRAIDDCLRIQSLLLGTGKSSLIRKIVAQHAGDNNWTLDSLLDRYATHLYSQWDLRWQDTVPFRDYLNQQRIDLDKKHKLPNRLIKSIAEKCEEQFQVNQSIKK